ncbi:MAG TPA: hypothetical protein VNI57_08175, partial [Candidatus Saccharimonadales bacterium]|nr:hypothetical protein [Candidatus Saccharimonadales bacterium]
LMNSGMYAYVTGMDKNDMSEASFDRYARKKNQLLYYEEGVTATVMVAKNAGEKENLFLALDGKVDASTAGDIQTQLLVGHVPMLYARTTSDVVVVGYATGMTVGAASLHHVRSLTAVEIEKAVIEASKLFTPYNNDPLSNPKVKIVIGDGRNFLQVTPDKYDVIISEPPNPWMTIAANLFTREYFQMGKDHLKPGGIFCGWVQLYGLPPNLVRAVLRTFGEVFPHISVYMPIPYADLVLLGSERPLEPDIPLMAEKMKDPRVAADLARIGIHSVPELLTYHVLDDAGARAFAGRGPINTDDNAMIEFQAPLSLYAGTRMPNAKALLPYLSDPLKGAVGLPGDPAEAADMYARLGEAFFDRRIAGRAVAAFNAAQRLHPTEERAERMLQIQKWFEDRIEELRRQELGG